MDYGFTLNPGFQKASLRDFQAPIRHTADGLRRVTTVGISGATGFVGAALQQRLVIQGHSPRRFLRRPDTQLELPDDRVVGDIGPETDWRFALDGVDCVVHLAARTHILNDRSADSLTAYRHINVDGTRKLALQAASAGVRRFIFMSSIKVNGESTADQPYRETDKPAPVDAYGISKHEAEGLLRDICSRSGMELVILRPPLVYGPGVKGNFLRLMRLIQRGIPLPLASVCNHRSLIHVENLADAICSCIDNPAAAGQTFLASDSEGVSTIRMITLLAEGLNTPARLFPFPPRLLQLAGAMLGQSATIARLTSSLSVSSAHLRNVTGWQPRIPLDQGLIETAQWYHRAQIQQEF
jgi:nucleoside-diphosphate-sugar epimerase